MKTHTPNSPSEEDSSTLHRREQAQISPNATPALLKKSVDRAPGPSALVALAKKIQGVRERRDVFLGNDLISETGWEMLIALYQSDVAMHRMTVSNLCQASHAPTTTALRWIDRLAELGLVSRHNHMGDGRVVYVELTPSARTAMNACLADIWVTLSGSG